MPELYHKYVFDLKNRAFVGKFEEMYANEDKEGFDSWHQENLDEPTKQISLQMIRKRRYASALDLGCGKGAFTNLLKGCAQKVTGVDIAQTAIDKAKAKYKGITFIAGDSEDILGGSVSSWDLIVMMEILSYLKNWKGLIAGAARKCRYFFVSLYLPPDPIGFIKNYEELKQEIEKYFEVIDEHAVDGANYHLMAQAKG